MRRGSAMVLLAFVTGWLLAGPTLTGPAYADPAAPGDEVERMRIDYRVTADGVLQVREEIAYRFGGFGRHGIYRDLIIRERYVDDRSKDQRYDVSKVKVSSPTGASTDLDEQTLKTDDHRAQTLRLKIGSADKTVDRTETYLISYEVRGALRHFDDHSELYWDATGSNWQALIKQAQVTVEVPEGVQRVECFAGPPRSTEACDNKSVAGGKGTFAEANIVAGSQLTVVAGIKPGVVSNDTPLVDDPPGALERAGLSLPVMIGAGVLTVLILIAGAVRGRRIGRDDRYAGAPPGTVPPAGATPAPVVKNTLADGQLPVAFAPPRIAVAEGGLLIDAVANTRETAATLIDLAVRGAVRIDNTGDRQHAVLLDPARATVPHEQVLIRGLFPSLQPGSAIALERRPTGDTSMREAHDAMTSAVHAQVKDHGWYARLPHRSRSSGGGLAAMGGAFGCLVGLVVALGVVLTTIAGAFGLSVGAGLLMTLAVPAVAAAGTLGYQFAVLSRGIRTATGRALTDQVIGFRTYLATAEAEQLRFEEGEDIFSKYLPWAIVFDLADRWQRLCARLVAAGRIPAEPAWYSGPSYYTSGFNGGAISDTVAQTFDPPPAPPSSGGGSSSGFSGGSSGGGGGGGGGGSW